MAHRFREYLVMRAAQALHSRLTQKSGNILVYIVMVMVIFAVLGVAMVSLFSTSISSSATANDTRRATYLSESGIRFAASELRSADFSKTSITTLNNTVYTVSGAGRFDLNVFSPWFESASSYPLGTQSVNVDVPEGVLPAGFLTSLPASDPDFLLINYNYLDLSNPDAQSPITGFAFGTPPWTPTSFQIQLANDFVANVNEQVAFAVKPFAGAGNQTIPSPGVGVLDLKLVARNVFPQAGGAFTVKDRDFYYKGIDTSITDRVRLMGVTPAPAGTTSYPDTIIATDDPVILTPLRNRLIVSEGRSGQVSFGNSIDYAAAIVDHSSIPSSRKPDIDFEEEDLSLVLSRNTYDSGFAGVDNVGKKVTFTKTGAISSTQLGSVWFQDSRAIGGQRDFCQSGRCFFKDGIRAFFLMTFTGNGDGFTFSLLSAEPNPSRGGVLNNTAASVGGDFQMGELLGYAGDSRLDNNSPTPTFLDGAGNGLQPPKMAVEFDGFYNNTPGSYCIDNTTVRTGTRNDPEFSGSGKDTVQYVFWGNRNPIFAPCRANNASYDDNRHNASNGLHFWSFNAGARVRTKPVVSPSDGTIYVGSGSGSNDGRVYAINPDGTQKWVFNSPSSGDDEFSSSPALDSNGNIYIGSDDDYLYSLSPTNGSQRWARLLSGDVKGGPAVDETRTRVYVGSDNKFYAINKDSGAIIWTYPPDPATAQFISSPAIDPLDGTIYVGSTDGHLYAFNPSGPDSTRVKWSFAIPGLSPIQSSPRINPVGGNIYFGSNDNRVYALNRSGGFLWARATSDDVITTPAVTTDGLTIYAGSDDGHLYAWTSNGTPKWTFPSDGTVIGAVRSSPAIDSDGTIYFGTDGGKLFAVNPDGSLKWTFPSSGNVGVIRSSPTIGLDGIIYVGSDDGNVYAIDPLADPRNIRSLSLTGTELGETSADNWFEAGPGPWAVRVEVDRSQSTNANGNYEYTLRTWMRRCTDASACSDIVGTFYGDTRVRYEGTPLSLPKLPMTQTIELEQSDHDLFNRFLFGFTSSIGGGTTQTITISKFQLSFTRPNDPAVTADPNWPPP